MSGGMSHGNVTCYRSGCRDAACVQANTVYSKKRRLDIMSGNPRTVSPLGTVRRIHALHRLGWTLEHIATESGLKSLQAVERITKRKRITVATAARIDETYERLSMKLGPSVPGRARAERLGYPPPLAWDDIDDPSEQPKTGSQRTTYLAADLTSEWYHLRDSGESIQQAARQLGVTVKAIEKAGERVAQREAS